MLYLFWAILNIGLFISFLIIAFKATVLIREKMGMIVACFFVFGLLSYMGNSAPANENLEPNSNQVKTWDFISSDSLDKGSNGILDVNLEKTFMSSYDLGINYGKDKEREKYIPHRAYTSVTGFIAGTSWKPTYIVVNRTDDNQKLRYEVGGIIKWKLLGMTVYSQAKNWSGFAIIK